jgi:iron complex outermembrane receptor protein
MLTAVNPNLALFDRQKIADLTIGTPKEKVVLGAVSGAAESLSASLRNTRYGAIPRPGRRRPSTAPSAPSG